MAGAGTRKRLAADSNLLFDLAAERDFAHTFREVFQELGYTIEVPPTVVQELTFKAFRMQPATVDAQATEEKRLARRALESALAWGLRPFDLKPTGHGITEEFVRLLHRKRLLVEEEFNDGLILAECALAEIPLLVTSDSHLLNIDTDELRLCFEDRDLLPVAVAHPRKLLQAVR